MSITRVILLVIHCYCNFSVGMYINLLQPNLLYDKSPFTLTCAVISVKQERTGWLIEIC